MPEQKEDQRSVAGSIFWTVIMVVVLVSAVFALKVWRGRNDLVVANAMILSAELKNASGSEMVFRLKVMPMASPDFEAYFVSDQDGRTMADFQPGSVRMVRYDGKTLEVKKLD